MVISFLLYPCLPLPYSHPNIFWFFLHFLLSQTVSFFPSPPLFFSHDLSLNYGYWIKRETLCLIHFFCWRMSSNSLASIFSVVPHLNIFFFLSQILFNYLLPTNPYLPIYLSALSFKSTYPLSTCLPATCYYYFLFTCWQRPFDLEFSCFLLSFHLLQFICLINHNMGCQIGISIFVFSGWSRVGTSHLSLIFNCLSLQWRSYVSITVFFFFNFISGHFGLHSKATFQ